jgi:putative peptidoglycan lipid II flippase
MGPLIKKILAKKQGSVGSAALLLMVTVMVSRVLGLLRDRLLAGVFTPDELGIYFAAFRLPNMLFELLVMGVLTTAFIPVFTRLLSKKSEAAAWNMASVVINYGVVTYCIIALPFIFFTKNLSQILAPGFSPEQQVVMARLTQLMIIFQVLPLMVGNFFTGILQSYKLFFLPALAPIFYNLGTIAGVVVLAPSLGLMAPVVGVIIGSVLFLCIQIPALLVLSYRHRMSLNTRVEGVREVGKLMLPRTIGLGVSQIDTTVDLMLASLLGSRMVTIFNFAQHLQQLPIGLFGATIAQAALPTLSRSSAIEDRQAFRAQLVSAIHQILFFVLPISVVFIILRIPITRLVFGSDQFDWEATVLTGKTLSAFSISLFAQAMLHVLVRAFYALYDTKTPVVIGIFGIGLNVFLSVIFIHILHMPVWSLGLSTSIATIIHTGILLHLLAKRIGRFAWVDVVVAPVKMVVAVLIMGLLLFGLQRLLDQLIFDTTRTINVALLLVTVGSVGMVSYIFLSWVLGVGQVDRFIVLLQKIRKLKRIFPVADFSTQDSDKKQI